MCSTSSTVLWNKPSGTGKMRFPMHHGLLRKTLVAVLLLGAFSVPIRAADISVSAELTRPRISAGEMAELQLRVSGAQAADVPPQIAVEGLQINLAGQQTQVQMVNLKVSSSVVYSYAVTPLKTGNFTIPSVTVAADGKQFRTAPLSFSVTDAVPPPAAVPPSNVPGIQTPAQLPTAPARSRVLQRPQSPQGQLAFGEIECPKRSLYAGEVVPVEIRYYFDARYPVQVRGKLDFGSEGVIVERFPDPKESHEERNGIEYNVLTFKTLLSAVKPGTIRIPPAKLDSEIQLPGAVPPGFDDPVFRQLLGGRSPFAESRQVAVRTAALALEILPLPKEGRPASFSGAIGQFDIDAMVQNPRPAPGDPATLTVKIGGKGNFKGMGAPMLTEADGWRSYPPSDKFDSSDELSYAGVKSFDFTLIAQEARESSPGAEFSYFDPATAKYVTLSTKPLPLHASPGVSPPPSAQAPASPPPENAGSPPATQPAKEGDPFTGITLRSWRTPAHRPEFLIASVAMLVAVGTLAGILLLLDIQARGGTAATRRRRRLTELWSSLQSEVLDAASMYDAAVEYAGLVIAGEDRRAAVIASLTDQRDMVKYGSGGSRPLPQGERESLLRMLRELSGQDSR